MDAISVAADPAARRSLGTDELAVRDVVGERRVELLSRRGVVMKPGNPFDVYVGQVDAFVEMAKGEYNSTA